MIISEMLLEFCWLDSETLIESKLNLEYDKIYSETLRIF